jgi:periplasmic divalent cation tolerance protein
MSEQILLIFSTFPEGETARDVVEKLVSEKLAACGNIIPTVESIYRWKDKVENATEALVLLKTTKAQYPAFQDRLKALHPYEVPEIICLDVVNGLPDYLAWVAANTLAT